MARDDAKTHGGRSAGFKGHPLRAQRRDRAAERTAAAEARSVTERLTRLDERLDGSGAARERARISGTPPTKA